MRMKYLFFFLLALIMTTPLVHGAILPVFSGGTGAGTLTGCLTGNGISPITGSGSPCSSGGTFPFSTTPNYNSTSTPIGFFNGLFSNSTTTVNGNLFLPTLSQGYVYTGSNGIVKTVSTSTLAGQVFPFTNQTNYNSTSTTIGFLNGLFSTASSTFNNSVFFSNLPQGLAFIGTNGFHNTVATSTLSGTGVISVTAGAYVPGATPIVVACATCGTGSVTSITEGTGLVNNGTTITTTGTILGAVGTSTTPTIGQIPFWSSTGSGGTTALLHSTATGTVTCAGNATCGTTSYVIGGNLTVTSPFSFSTTPNYNATGTTIGFSGGLFSTASSTFNNNVFFSNLTQGYAFIGSNGFHSTVSTSTLAGQVFPFTNFPNYNATGTTIGFSNGIFSTASSTFNNSVFFSNLPQGVAFIGTNGFHSSVATGTITCTGSVSCGTTSSVIGSNLTITGTGGGSDPFTHPFLGGSASTSMFALGTSTMSHLSQVTIGTTSPFAQLGIFSGGGVNGWIFANKSGNFYLSSTSVDGLSTTTTSAFQVVGATTTISNPTIKNIGRITQLGACDANNYIPTGGTIPSYLIINRCNASQDGSILWTDAGVLKWEVGLTGDGDMHWKTATSTESAGYQFLDRMTMNAITGAIGYGTSIPTGALEVATTAPQQRAQVTITNKNTGAGTKGSLLAFSNNAWTNYLGTDAGLNGNQNAFWNWGNFGTGLFMDSSANIGVQNASISPGSSLTVTGTTDISGRLGVGSTTPWAQLSVASTTYDFKTPLFLISTTSSRLSTLLSVFSTTTTFNGTTGGLSNGTRVGIGTTTYYGLDMPADTLDIDGPTDNIDWNSISCTPPKGTTQTANTANSCGDGWTFMEDNDGQLTSNSGNKTGLPYFQISTPTVGLGNTNSGAGLVFTVNAAGTLPLLGIATNTPVIKAMGSTNGQATSTSYFLGFTDTVFTGSAWEVGFRYGCVLTASSTQANWIALCTTGTATTTVNMGVASTTAVNVASGGPMMLRVSVTDSVAEFYVASPNGGSAHKFITTNLPTAGQLTPALWLTTGTGGAASSRYWRGSYLNLWWKTPMSTQTY